MDGVKKESASEITNPPGSGPCRPALPGLFFIIDIQKREIFIPGEMIEEEGPDLRNGQIGKVIRWKKP